MNWIILLLLISFCIKSARIKKSLRLSALFVFIVFSNGWLLDSYARAWQPLPRNVTADTPYSCGIVLGGFAGPDRQGNGNFNQTADRFIQTVKLYKQGKIQHILISGGSGKKIKEGFREAIWAKQQMEDIGIPGAAILCEDQSDNTADNVYYARKLLDTAQLKPPYLLITSAFHMPRAKLQFEHAGIAVVDFPCNYLSGNNAFSWKALLPDPEALATWNYFLKEMAGYVFYSLKKK